MPKWLSRLQILDSTTITLFSNLIFKGVGRHPKTGRKKGGMKMHANVHANEGVPSDIRFTAAATNDSFMLRPSDYHGGDILAIDRAYIDYAKFEEFTRNGVVYVTKMKKNLTYETVSDTMYQNGDGLMQYRIQHVIFRKKVKGGEDIEHHARIITYVDTRKKKARLVSLLTNDMEMDHRDLPPTMGDRAALQATQAELPAEVLLRGERQCHQDTGLGDAHRQPADHGHAEEDQA